MVPDWVAKLLCPESLRLKFSFACAFDQSSSQSETMKKSGCWRADMGTSSVRFHYSWSDHRDTEIDAGAFQSCWRVVDFGITVVSCGNESARA